MPSAPGHRSVSPALVGLCAWLVPGGGYFLLGHRGRAITIFTAILFLFLTGILIGGIRVMDPPGWGQYGYMTLLVLERRANGTTIARIEPNSADQNNTLQLPRPNASAYPTLRQEPMTELGNKPWFVGQILCGPITLAAAGISVHAARDMETREDGKTVQAVPTAHARSWEIGALYTAVAGMLNLLAIIDSTFRAGQPRRT